MLAGIVAILIQSSGLLSSGRDHGPVPNGSENVAAPD